MPAQNAKTDQTQANGDSSRTLADILVSYGALEAQKAKQVKLAEIQTGKSQEDILMSQKLVDETSLTKAKAELYDVPFIDLASVPVSPEALSLLPQEVAMRFKAFPVQTQKKKKKKKEMTHHTKKKKEKKNIAPPKTPNPLFPQKKKEAEIV